MASKKILYGGETQKAVDNFPISGETVPPSVIHWLGRIKGAAARANAELERLDPTLAESIAQAGDAVGRGDHDGQFPIDVFQTGSGTSSNMNANEVIASLAGKAVHPNDHVNMGQSSNDVFPSAVHLAALDEATNTLLPALKQLERSLTKKAKRFENVVKAGRTHLMDAVPVTLGQEFAGYAAQIRLGQERIEAALVHVRQIPLGGTATGTGLNTHPQFAEKVRKLLSKETRLKIDAPADPFEAQGNRDALVELSGALKVVAVSLTKIAQDIALMGSGPRAGVGELYLPELQKGSSIMPGKVNPVIPEVVLQVSAQVIGNDTAVTIGGMQGQFELNVRVPLMARNVLQSIHLLSTASVAFAEKVIDGVAVNKEGTERSAAATLAVATALNEHIGYDKATTIVKKAADSGRMLRDVAIEEGVDPELYDRVIDLRRIAAGSQADQQERPAANPKPKPKPRGAASSNGRKRGQRAPA
jgi:fumarate hydratase class II